MHKKLALIKANKHLIGYINNQELISALRMNLKMLSSVVSFYNLLTYYGYFNTHFEGQISFIKGYLLSFPNVQKHGKFLTCKGQDIPNPLSHLPAITKEEKKEHYHHYKVLMDFFLSNPSASGMELIPNAPERPKNTLDLNQLMEKVRADPKAYIPAFHEDFVYSDANWSSRDAHL